MQHWPPHQILSLYKQPIDWSSLQSQFDWLVSLKDVPQDPKFHAEGDVFTHIQMVIEELITLKEWDGLAEHDKATLFLAALFHDLGKLYCTQVDENGAITSFGHAQKGAHKARLMLWKGIPEPVPFDFREKIVRLIRAHGLPLWFWEKSNPLRSIRRTSLLVEMFLLEILTKADVKGRICNDKDYLLDRIEFFRNFCIENACYEQPFKFESTLSRFYYFNGNNSEYTYIPYDAGQFEVILMSGLPGVGKDTWITKHASNLPIISLDKIRKELKIRPEKSQGKVISMAKNRAKELLRKRQPFIWNATNISRNLRNQLIQFFTVYHAKVKIVYIETAYRTLLERNKKRTDGVPLKVLDKLINKLEIPDLTEAHTVEYVIKQ